MTLAILRDEPVMTRLDEIETEIAGLLSLGTLFHNRRAEAAARIIMLHQEGLEISQNPKAYQPREPWQIDGDEARDRRARQMAQTAFRDAPQGDPLTEALVDIWTRNLREAANAGEDEFRRAESAMAQDARMAEQTVAEACTLGKPSIPENPAAFLQALKALTEQALRRTDEMESTSNQTWLTAGRHALARLLETIEWVQCHGVDTRKDTTADRRAAAGSVVALAEEFNEIRFAIRRRCA